MTPSNATHRDPHAAAMPPPRLISSRRPHYGATLCGVLALILLAFGAHEFLTGDRIPWVLLTLSLVHAAVAVLCLVVWKTVRQGQDCYAISDPFRTETVPLSDICLIVRGSGLLCSLVRIHFNRQTQFGWRVSFIPRHQPSQSHRNVLSRNEA